MSQAEAAPGRYSFAHHSLANVVAAQPANNRTRNGQTWQTNGWQTNEGGAFPKAVADEESETDELPVVIRLPHHSLAHVVVAGSANNQMRNGRTWQTNGWQTNVREPSGRSRLPVMG
jgi:hypothetical protein